ncbi:lamina-associated polypeptide 2-like [Rhinatrema bivittatum]|uniref:lamina-associated polypeptide 2-like n=1 Tax=Rhinatrema bivittatum TaxID=194408 RepID=UPI0011297E66|nr:lamina-associated polypeptide 2-like [Rhinatrema bivittatum]
MPMSPSMPTTESMPVPSSTSMPVPMPTSSFIPMPISVPMTAAALSIPMDVPICAPTMPAAPSMSTASSSMQIAHPSMESTSVHSTMSTSASRPISSLIPISMFSFLTTSLSTAAQPPPHYTVAPSAASSRGKKATGKSKHPEIPSEKRLHAILTKRYHDLLSSLPSYPAENSDTSDGAPDIQDPLPGPSGVPPSTIPSHPSYPQPEDTWSDTQSEYSSEEFLSEGTPPQTKKQSPPEDLSFASFVQEMSESIPFQLQAEKDDRQQTLEILQFVDPPKHNLAIPVHEVLLQLQQRIWEHPCTTPGVNRRIDSTYLVQAAPGFEKPQLPHSSLVVESAQKKSRRSRTHASIPPGKDNRFLDLMGRKIYQGAMLNAKIAAYQLYITQHQRNLWKQIEEFLPSLPQQQQEAAQHIVQKGLDAGKHEVRAAYDAFETSSRTAASGISARRWAWLKASDLRPEVQDKLVDLPCLGDNLFGTKVQDAVTQLREHSETLKQLSTLSHDAPTHPARRPPRRDTRRPFFRPRRYYPQTSRPRSTRPPQRPQQRQQRAARPQPPPQTASTSGF